MKMRTSKPVNNKFYITDEAGGYSACIVGYPMDRGANVLANCVGYACGRFNEIIGKNEYPYFNCNAENFITRAKDFYPNLEIGQTPKVGAIMVWAKGQVGISSDGAGHVGIVEKVIDTNTIYTSESGYGSSAFWNATRSNSNGRWGIGSGYTFLGFIYNPAIKDKPVPTPVPTPAPSGETVYIVVKGDTLSGIASKYGTTYQTLASYNGIANPNKIYVGQKIKIPNGGTTTIIYTVVRGDSLSKIATRYGTSWQKIYADNKNVIGTNPNYITVGMRLNIIK